jgi:hypothetical protein
MTEASELFEPEASHTERELITGVFYDAKGVRHEYAYTAVGFAYERVARMLNQSRGWRER